MRIPHHHKDRYKQAQKFIDHHHHMKGHSEEKLRAHFLKQGWKPWHIDRLKFKAKPHHEKRKKVILAGVMIAVVVGMIVILVMAGRGNFAGKAVDLGRFLNTPGEVVANENQVNILGCSTSDIGYVKVIPGRAGKVAFRNVQIGTSSKHYFLEEGTWLESRFSGGRNPGEEYQSLNPGTRNFLVGDFNDDGKDDLVTAVKEPGQGDEMLTTFTSDGSSLSLTRSQQVSGNLKRWVVGDFDGDGSDDLAHELFIDNNYKWRVAFWQRDTWDFGEWGEAQVLGTEQTTFASGDFNDDGNDDIVKWRKIAKNNIFWVGTSNGRDGFEGIDERWLQQYSGTIENVFVGDFTHDGIDDLLVQSSINSQRKKFEVLASDKTRFEIGHNLIVPGANRDDSYLVGDVDNDHYPDLLWGHMLDANTVKWKVYKSKSDGFENPEIWADDIGAWHDKFFIGNFDGRECPSVCREETLGSCENQRDCSGVSGYWYDESCHRIREPNILPTATVMLEQKRSGLDVDAELEDEDGDPVKPIYNWIFNGNPILKFYVPFEAGVREFINNLEPEVDATYEESGALDQYGAYSFDGERDFVEFAADASHNLQRDFTISAWIKPEGWGPHKSRGWGRVFQKEPSALAMALEKNSANGGKTKRQSVSVFFKVGNDYKWFGTDEDTITLGAWHHVVVSFDGNAPRIYINGEDVTVGQVKGAGLQGPADLNENEDDFLVIGNRKNRQRSFDGLIDEFQIYDRVLSAEQIDQMYHRNGPRYDKWLSPEVGEWKVEVTPHDGKADGNPVESDPVVVQSCGQDTDVACHDDFECLEGICTPLQSCNEGGFNLNPCPFGTSCQGGFCRETELNLGNVVLPGGGAPQNEPPEIGFIDIELDQGTLTGTPGQTSDEEEDEVFFVYNWLYDNTQLMLLNLPFEADGDENVRDFSGHVDNVGVSADWIANGGVDGHSAFRFGPDKSVTIPANPSLNLVRDFSVSAWINPTGWGGHQNGWGKILQKGDMALQILLQENSFQGSDARSLSIRILQGQSFLWFGTLEDSITLNAWNHIVVSFDGRVPTVVINGNSVAVRQFSGPDEEIIEINSNEDDILYIGNDGTGQGYFEGIIDQFQIYAKVISEEQASLMYDGGAGKANVLRPAPSWGSNSWAVEVFPLDGFGIGLPVRSPTRDVQAACASNDECSLGQECTNAVCVEVQDAPAPGGGIAPACENPPQGDNDNDCVVDADEPQACVNAAGPGGFSDIGCPLGDAGDPDGCVNFGDIRVVQQHYNSNCNGPPGDRKTPAEGDATGDGCVTFADIRVIQQNYDSNCGR